MTGFGSAEGNVLGGRLSLEIRRGDHRHYKPQLQLPFGLGGGGGPLRGRRAERLPRGHGAGFGPGGAAVAAELGGRLRALETGAATIERRAPERLTAELARLKKAVAELATGVQVDEQRLAVEVALMADRVDITEELVRLRTHLAACGEALASDGAVGKQLGFLAQELLREVNTIGSKANDAAITQTVIAMKGELEKLREQLDNLE